MQSIEKNKKSHPILNQIYDILAIIQAQDRKVTLWKVLAHTRNNRNEEADKAAKEVIDMLGVTTRKLPYTDYYSIIRKVRNSNGKGNWNIVIANYTTSNKALKSESAHHSCKQYNVKLSRLCIGH